MSQDGSEPVAESVAEADAVHEMALRAAEGVCVAQDWAAALDHARHAARLGSRLAQAELAALSGNWALAHELLQGGPVAEAGSSLFSDPIELATWLEPPKKQIVSDHPRIAAVKDFAPAEMCDWLIWRARPKLSRALIADRATGEQRMTSDQRTNSVCGFRLRDSDLILAILRARIAGVTGMPVPAMESPNVLHYSVGQEFHPHFDIIINEDVPNYREQLGDGKQRTLTFLLSLNDDYAGGETEFPRLGMRWRGRRGRAMFFWNVEADGTPDRQTLHAGLPVTEGEKWMLSQWIDGRPTEIDIALAGWA